MKTNISAHINDEHAHTPHTPHTHTHHTPHTRTHPTHTPPPHTPHTHTQHARMCHQIHINNAAKVNSSSKSIRVMQPARYSLAAYSLFSITHTRARTHTHTRTRILIQATVLLLIVRAYYTNVSIRTPRTNARTHAREGIV